MATVGYILIDPEGVGTPAHCCDQDFRVEAKGLEPSNLLTASQALYQLSYAPEGCQHSILCEPKATSRSASSPPEATTPAN